MAIHRASVTFVITVDDDREELKTTLSFSPAIVGNESKKWKKMTEGQRMLQNYVAGVANHVMNQLEAAAKK